MPTHKIHHRSLIFAFLLFASYSQSGLSLTVSRGPYLQIAADDSITIRWRTDSNTDSVVRYGNNPTNLDQTVNLSGSRTEHEVKITGLSPSTQYYYSVGDSSVTLAGGNNTYRFMTAPTAGNATSTRIWLIGDSGTANSNAAAVYNAYLNYPGADETNLWIMLGDNAYNDGTDSQYQSAVFNMYPELLRRAPLWPTLGNHDGHSADSASESGPYYDIFTLPRNAEAGGLASGTEAYYSFDYGNIHFVCLDSYESNRSVGGAMLTWLENDLAANDKKWSIAFWHHPPYTKGSHNSDTEGALIDMRQNALPILESHGVDMVFSGHSHSYERSFLIDGHYGASSSFNSSNLVDAGDGREDGNGVYSKADQANNAGVVYTVAGASGKISGGNLNHPAMFTSLNQLGSVILDVNDNRLDAYHLRSDGVVTDHYTLSKDPNPTITTVDSSTDNQGNIPSSGTVSFKNGVTPDNNYLGSIDTYIASGVPTNNFGTAATLLADGEDGSNGELAALIKWDVSDIPSDATITEVRIELEVSNTSSGTYNLYDPGKTWNEYNVNWNSIDPYTNRGQIVGKFSPFSTGNYPITLNSAGIALVQNWVNGLANNGVLLMTDGSNDGVDIRSSDYNDNALRPKLTITYNSASGRNGVPVADFTFSVASLNVNFADTSIDTDGGIVKWLWDFGDGNSATSQNQNHSYAREGSYDVSLTVTDTNGNTNTTTQTVSVGNIATPITIELQQDLNDYTGAEDTYVAAGSANSNYGDADSILADGDDGSRDELSTLFRWDVSNIPTGAIITDVTLTLQVYNRTNNVYNFWSMLNTWKENTATWSNSLPATNRGANIGSFKPTSIRSYSIQFNAEGVAMVQSWVNGGINDGFSLASAGTRDGIDIWSSEYRDQTQRPKLTITYQ